MAIDFKAALAKSAPKADPRFVASFAGVAEAKFAAAGFDSPRALAGILAQMQHETSGFREFQENMNYSARRLMAVWPSRFRSLAAAQPYAGNPPKLANLVYANRMGNGPPASGDGWANRGGGLLHHTGAAEYARVKRRTGHDQDTIRNPARADAMLDAAITYCEDRRVIGDLQLGRIESATVKINGGRIGLSDRQVLYARWLAVLARQPAPSGRTNVESRDRARAQAVGLTGASATTAAGGAAAPSPHADLPGWAVAMAIVGVAALLGLAAWLRLRRADEHQRVIDAERNERRESVAAMEG